MWAALNDGPGATFSPLAIRREDVILLRHSRMAEEPTIDDTGLVGREAVRRDIIVERGIGPTLRVRVFLLVLFNEEDVLKVVRDPHKEGRLIALLRFPLDLRNLGAVRERLAVAREAGLVGVDHG